MMERGPNRRWHFFWGVTSVFAVVVFLFTYAGNLEPPGPPSPTMHSLEEIHALLESIAAQQEANLSGDSVGLETRMKACMTIEGGNQGKIEGDWPGGDAADPVCGGFGSSIRVVNMNHVLTHPTNPQDGQPSGKRIHNPLQITKHVDRATPLLYEASKIGELLTVVVRFYRIGSGGAEHYYTVQLEDAHIVEVQATVIATVTGFLHAEDVRMVYRQAIWQDEIDGKVVVDDWN